MTNLHVINSYSLLTTVQAFTIIITTVYLALYHYN